MQSIKIAIDPTLKQKFGAEISWTWRTLLSAAGLQWEEVAGSHPDCDIAYLLDLDGTCRSKVVVKADLRRWSDPSKYRLERLFETQGWLHPVYQDDVTLEPIVEPVAGQVLCKRDVIFDVFWLATGQEERFWPTNRHGHFHLSDREQHLRAVPRLAVASGIGVSLEDLLRDIGVSAFLPRWPEGRCAAACVGHDVDYPEVIAWLEPLRILRRQGLTGLANAADLLRGRRSHWHFTSWVELESSLETRSAFYFVARKGSLIEYAMGTPDPFYDIRSDRFERVFAQLSDEGFEIGLHASYRAHESLDRLAGEKKLLEEASGREIRGIRHHYWHLDPRRPESTLLMHEKAGLTYDTSLTHERYLGWRRAMTWPFFPYHQEQRRQLGTLQIPTGWMDDQLFGYRSENPGNRKALLEELANRVANQGGCLMIDVHDYVYDESLFPEWRTSYVELWRTLLERGDFWFATPSQIADHWIQRYSRIVDGSRGLADW